MSDRRPMLLGATIMTVGLAVGAAVGLFGQATEWPFFLLTLFVIGVGYSMTQTPSGCLLRRFATADDRSAVFAAQFSLSHLCWLLTYPLAGQIGIAAGLPAAFGVLAVVALLGTLSAWALWSANDAEELVHSHGDDDASLAHLETGEPHGAGRHKDAYAIDELHLRWPTSGN